MNGTLGQLLNYLVLGQVLTTPYQWERFRQKLGIRYLRNTLGIDINNTLVLDTNNALAFGQILTIPWH